MRIYGDDNVVRLEVMREMTGTGALLITMSEEDANADNANVISSRLEALMRAETFRGYPMYFPLLDENSLRKMSREELESLLPGCLLYFREDTVENGSAYRLENSPGSAIWHAKAFSPGRRRQHLALRVVI